VTVAVDSNDGSGWVERVATPYSASATAGAGGCAFAYARPDSTVAGGGFSASGGGGLFAQVDETSPSDSDYISAGFNESAPDAVELGLSNVTDPLTSSGHKIRVRYKFDTAPVGSAIVYLLQGGTTKASFALGGAAGSYTTESYTLSASEADSITDYTDLRLKIELNPDLGDATTFYCSWMEFALENATYNETNWTHEQKTIVVSGLGLNDDMRVRIKSVENPSNLTSFSVHAFDGSGDPASGVTYTTTSGDHYASMTPDTEDNVAWEAFAV
jgi:hypothetical protein